MECIFGYQKGVLAGGIICFSNPQKPVIQLEGALRLLAKAALMSGLWVLEASVVTTFLNYEIHTFTPKFIHIISVLKIRQFWRQL
jgi:hypothetical protein